MTASLADLPDEDVAELMKFFYMTYQRITEERNCLSLKSGKIFPVHKKKKKKKGIGMLHRALFTTEKKSKKKGTPDDD